MSSTAHRASNLTMVGYPQLPTRPSNGGNPMVRSRRRDHRMRRVLMLLAVLLAAGMTDRGVMAQQLSRVPHVGVLAPLSREQNRQPVDDFRAGMRALGWT